MYNTAKIEQANTSDTYWIHTYYGHRPDEDGGGGHTHTLVYINSKDAEALRLFLNSYHDYGDTLTLGES